MIEQAWIMGGMTAAIVVLSLAALYLFSPPRPSVPEIGPVRFSVRPLNDLAPDPAHLYLGDGIARDLAALLQRFERVEAAVGEEPARFVMEGTVRKQGPRLTMHLYVNSGKRGMWRGAYDAALKDVPRIEEQAVASLARSMRLFLKRGA
jgi:TolB-like protein